MTSNLGSQLIQEMAEVEDDYDAMQNAVMEVVKKYLRPEYINRIDDVVVFHALNRAQIRAIANLQVNLLRKRLQSQNIDLFVTDAALEHIGTIGFDPVYGVRPLKRAVQHHLENPLAERILSGDFAPGDTIEMDWNKGKVRLSKFLSEKMHYHD